ncbi:MAG: hypothetical protein JW943_13060 [Deltaproteobacteria bacterium]|nr:hypothetical protein [Deltaproteobacteria bacterium]
MPGDEAGHGAPAADTRQVLQIISALHLVKMNLSMYPDGHAKIDESLDDAFLTIRNILAGNPEISIGVAGGTLMAGKTPLDKRNAAVRDYAQCLTDLRIIYFKLSRGLKKTDLIEFNRILSSKPSDIWAMGTTETVLAKAGVSAIEVKTLVVADFHLTEEKNITSADGAGHEKDEDIWWRFVKRSSPTSVPGAPKAVPGASGSREGFHDVLRILNAERKNWGAAVAHYEKIMKDFFFEVRSGTSVSAERYEELSRINSLIQNLHPDLKNQLLDAAGRQIAQQPEDQLSLDSLVVFPQEMLEEMTGIMKSGDSRISPTLIMLMQKMQDAGKDIEIIGQSLDEPVPPKSALKDLLKEEKGKYVPEDYNNILKESVIRTPSEALPDDDIFPVAEYMKSLADKNIIIRICRLLLDIMDEDADENDYHAYATNLVRLAPELIKSGQFDLLADAIDMLHRHSGDRSAFKIRQSALIALNAFSEADMIELIKSAVLDEAVDVEAVKRFFVISGPHHMNWLFDLYLERSLPPSHPIILILQAFGKEALDRAIKMLSDGNPQKVVRLLMLIRAFNDRRAVAAVRRSLFDHHDRTVTRELIEMLLQFNDYTVKDLIKERLAAMDHEEVMQAVNTICTHRLTDMMEDVMGLLTTFVIHDNNVLLQIRIVKEISETGDPAMLPCLERLAARWLTLTPARLYLIKETLYEGLKNFPHERVRNMLEKGKRSPSKKIRSICAAILMEQASS